MKTEILSSKSKKTRTSSGQILLTIPNENGIEEEFILLNSPVLSPKLQKKHPDIKTFIGRSKSRPNVKSRVSYSAMGLNVWIMLADGKHHFIQPLRQLENTYFSYPRSQKHSASFSCKTSIEIENTASEDKIVNALAERSKIVSDLKSFRIAVSGSGGYTKFWGDDDPENGTNEEDAYAAVVSTIHRVNEVFENDFGIHLELVSDVSLIYPDSDTDPYTSNLKTELQSTLDEVFGSENYDLGHLFAFSGSGNGDAGSVGNVCKEGRKGSAFSSHPFQGSNYDPFMNDYFDIDFVAHEIGHQFGAFHTYSYVYENGSKSVEPGSGTTIMGYAGITGTDNVARHSDPYFHYYSVQDVLSYIESNTCYTSSTNENQAPVIEAGPNLTIPSGTAYELIATAEDPEGTPLHYCWEQLDKGQVSHDNFGPNRRVGPQARSLPPSLSPTRTIPRMESVLTGKLTQTNPNVNKAWETVSTVERRLTWGLSVRDRYAQTIGQQGQVSFDARVLTVNAAAGPFVITSQNENGVIWEAGAREQIAWEVANTDIAPINTQTVNILLSTDGGQTFPTTLVSGTLNDGIANIIVPETITTNQARIKIIPNNSIYFTVNTQDIEIKEVLFAISLDTYSHEVCNQNNVTYNFEYKTFSGFNEAVSLSVEDLPAGVTAQLNPTNISATGSTGSIQLSGLNAIGSQDFIFNLVAVGASASRKIPLELMVRNESIDPVQLLFPSDQTAEVGRTIILSWTKDINVNSYQLELSKSENFEDTILTENISLTSFTLNNLAFATDYYWRVKSINPCEESDFTTNKFSTIIVNCNTYAAADLPLRIKDSNNFSGVTNVDINIVDLAIIEDLNVHVSIDHTYIGDISIHILTPDNTLIKLSQNLGDSLNDYTNTIFDQEAENPIIFAIPPFTGSYRPFESLSSLRGKNLNGRWRLIIEDNFDGVSGFLKDFSIAVCYKGDVLLDSDLDMIADIDDNCPNTANTDQLDSDGNGIGDVCDINSQGNFTISKKDVTCIGKRNGEITVNATAQFSYNLNVIGSNGQKVESTFSAQNEIMISNIPVGDYSVCITAIEDPNFERCFITTINAPDPLSVQTQLNVAKKSVSVELEGASKYNLKINNQQYSLSSGRHDFSLEQGLSTIEVKTELSCQGTVKREIYLSDQSSLYPNPARDVVNVLVGGKENQVKILLYKTDGTLLNETDLQLSELERAYQIPLDGQASGLYFIVIKKGGVSENLKLLKL